MDLCFFIMYMAGGSNLLPGGCSRRDRDHRPDQCADFNSCDAWKSLHCDPRARSGPRARGSAMPGNDSGIARLAFHDFFVSADVGPDWDHGQRSHGKN